MNKTGFVAGALALALAGGGVGYAAGAREDATATPPQSSLSEQDRPGIFDNLPQAPEPDSSGGSDSSEGSADTTSKASGDQLTGLVRIESTMEYAGGKGAGTGMVIGSDGAVVTNHHVVQGATDIEVTVMSTGESYDARVVGADDTADVALLQLEDAEDLDTVTPDSDAVDIGDSVTAVGDGNGTVSYLSAATGRVLATDRSITTRSQRSPEGEQLSGLVQISSDVVSGYSGGATYDDEGEVLGMTTAASSGSSDIVGYAIPISTVLDIAEDLDEGVQQSSYTYGYPAFIGVALGESGTVVDEAYDGLPADDAGIDAGDSILGIDDTATSTVDELRAAIAAHDPGDEVTVTWADPDGSRHSEFVELVEGPVA